MGKWNFFILRIYMNILPLMIFNRFQKEKNIVLYYKNRPYTVFIPDGYIKYIDIYHFYNEAGPDKHETLEYFFKMILDS